MADPIETCAFLPCRRDAIVSVRLTVEGSESVVPTCQGHAAWLLGYVEEDPAVRLVGEDDDETG
jgi:hypothetical protein